jgi:alkanesulfonate monooxygenase SsuD/methylene tetrahydromethanopterin reductase-like flavin-dependent oxidoreductase (luciferase family)
MRFGFNLPNFGEFGDARVLAEIAAAAEAGGWDGCFIWDHLFPVFVPEMAGIPTADTTVALTAIALATERIRFGAMITPLPRRRVQKFARELATLDRLSNGRVVCGVGIGEPPDAEFEAFGESGDDLVRAQRLDESLAVLTALWSGAPVDYDGAHLHVHTTALQPAPVQQPRIPIWVATKWPAARGPVRRATRHDGVFPIPHDPMNTFVTVEDLHAVCAAVGRADAFDYVVNPGPDADVAAFIDAGATWWIEGAFTRDEALQRAKEGPPPLA